MRVGSRRRSRRGVALVFALFTIALLITMSATVVGLAIRHGRTGASSSNAEAALHAANWGIEASLNYMGVGINQVNGQKHWAVVAYEQGYPTRFNLSTTNLNSPRPALGSLVKVGVTSQAAALDSPRIVKFYDPSSAGKEFELWIDAQTTATVEVLVTEIALVGQPEHYQLTSTARVRNAAGEVVATRVVEARVREQAASDFMHFIQNANAWDVNGVDPGTSTTNDIVSLPEGYREDGRMRVDGGGSVASTAGSVKFYGNGDWRFTGDVTMNGTKDKIRFISKGADNDLNRIFPGGLRTGISSLGLPQSENYVSFATGRASSAGGSGTSVVVAIKGDPSSAYNSTVSPSGVPDVMGVAGDARPSFAKVLITLNGADVTVEKVNPALPGASQKIYGGKASEIKSGIIAVSGGNVEVQSVTDSKGKAVPFTGQLTIVSSENPERPSLGEKSYSHNGSCIYSDAARSYYTTNPHIVPPYTARQLFPDDPNASDTQYFWPSPPAKIEREGNTMMTSDIVYGSGTRSPSLGVVAQNFVLLNDKDGNPDNLRLDAVLMSLDHSVQFDWDNAAKNPNHKGLLESGRDRTFQLNGAIVSGFLDVEGDVNRRGYFTQKFAHDKNLRFQLPPSFPRWDRVSSNATGVAWTWIILNYVDKGTLNQFNFN